MLPHLEEVVSGRRMAYNEELEEGSLEVVEVLKKNYLFQGLSEGQLDSVVGLAAVKEFNGGDTIVRQFDRNSDLMLILSGLACIKTFSDETLAEIGEGSIIGEVSLIDDQPRSANVVSVGGTSVAVIPSARLRELMDQDASTKAALMANIAKLLAQRLRTANIQLDSALAKGSR